MLMSLAKVTVKQFDVLANNGSVGQVCEDLQPFTLQLLSVKKFTTGILIQKNLWKISLTVKQQKYEWRLLG